ncbi:MAG: hypothetical protein GTN38_04850 [Candidatus Aenigmarchaeota archaeon]|nr:hypothetical protein [Candidatus Aenigmarchaeota archaeon]NIP41074.1 hypothetical protein [Candidatus Aenigmarchaeota archaeon]NIQ17476.1 hypothetical protein [Candidatus Aenigmarchaeota archaeon]NIS73670.1 hypothetical protein [Candidatus Aenigmarchaeota archaeon]
MRVERNICIRNSIEGYFEVEMILRGDLTEYATLSEYYLVLAPKSMPGGGKCVNFVLQLPEKLEKPGRHQLWVWAGQVVGGPEGETMLGGRVEVGTDLKIYVPIPGKYIEADFTVDSREVGEIVTFTISAINRGNQTIESAQGAIDIYDQDRNKIAFVKTNIESMEPSVWTEFKAQWMANVEPGELLANATIDYDGFKTFLSKDFRVGSPTAKILNVTYEPIVNGTIGTIKTEVISYWSQRIENAYVTITAKRGSYSGSSQSPSMVLNPWKKAEFTNFWDTSDAPGPGEYQGIATLSYLNKTDTKEFTLRVIEKPGFVFPDVMWIIVVILIIIFVVLILLTVGRRRKKFKQVRLA